MFHKYSCTYNECLENQYTFIASQVFDMNSALRPRDFQLSSGDWDDHNDAGTFYRIYVVRRSHLPVCGFRAFTYVS